MALQLASNIARTPMKLSSEESKRLGSVISICGPLLSTSPTQSNTPCLSFTRTSPQAAIHRRQVSELKETFKEVEVINGEKGKGGEDMPRGRTEWEGIMRFWGNLLAKDVGWKGEGEVYEVVK